MFQEILDFYGVANSKELFDQEVVQLMDSVQDGFCHVASGEVHIAQTQSA